MTIRRWWLWTVASALLAFGLWFVEGRVVWAASSRDLGEVPGRFAALEDGLADAQWAITLLAFLIAELPALLWRRRGGSVPGTIGVAAAVPLVYVSPGLIPKGHPEDQLIIFVLIAVVGLTTLVGGLICAVVRPVKEDWEA